MRSIWLTPAVSVVSREGRLNGLGIMGLYVWGIVTGIFLSAEQTRTQVRLTVFSRISLL